MRRSILATASRPSWSAASLNRTRRTFASSIGSKDTTPPTPVEPSQTQAHPIGAFYEAILRSPPFIPETKPEAAPVSSAPEVVAERPERPKPTPTTPAPAPAAQPTKEVAPKVAEPKKEEAAKPAASAAAAPAAAAAATKAKATATSAPKDKETPAKRTRTSKKTKSVVPDPESSSPSSSSSASSPTPTPTPIHVPTTSSSSSPPSSSSSSPPSSSISSTQSQSNDQPSPQQTSDQPDTLDPPSPARITFARSLAGPAERAERLAAIRSQSRLIAGVLVPPKPEEPDNCCMSGCVNCVWDRYRDDLEEWAAAEGEAERRMLARGVASDVEEQDGEEGESVGQVERVDASMAAADRSSAASLGTAADEGSMDDDGGGSETNWSLPLGATASAQGTGNKRGEKGNKEFWNEDLYKNVPVGIREFMKQEKRLKEKHLREGTVGG